MNSVVVTGATSMLGVALIEECINNNVKVFAIVRKNSKKIFLLPNSNLVEIVECNLDELCNLQINRKADVLFHLGWAGTSKEERNDKEIQNSNVNYSLDALALAKKMGCKRFIGIGSQAEYGVCNEKLNSSIVENPVTEYGKAKLKANKTTKEKAITIGIEHIWVRVLSVYGKNDNQNTLVMYLIKSFMNNEVVNLSNCEQIWDYLYSSDAGNALYLIGLLGKANKIYNLGSGCCNPLSYYVETIKEQLSSKTVINYGAIPYSENQIMYLCADISEITKDTGWKPKTSFEKGINLIIGG